MLEKDTYKRRFAIILLLGIILLFIIYNTLIKDTITVKHNYYNLKQRIGNIDIVNSSIDYYKNEIARIDSFIGSEYYLQTHAQDKVLSTITDFGLTNNIMILDFSHPNTYSNGNCLILTYKVIVAGEFCNLLVMLHNIEEIGSIGKIKSANFSLTNSHGDNNKQLQLTLYLQNLKEVYDENN